MQILEIFDRTTPAPGETWMHHEGNNYLILPQDISAFRAADQEWNHGPFVKYQSTKTDLVYLAEESLFMNVLWKGETVTEDMDFPLHEAYCRFEKVSQ